jgi:hypothetical protein
VLRVKNAEFIHIRLLEGGDPPNIAAAFKKMGWNKPEAQYRRYLREQTAGARTCFVAVVDGQFAGYVTVNWRPTYIGFSDLGIPEIQDLNVLMMFRRKGIASRLLDRADLPQLVVPWQSLICRSCRMRVKCFSSISTLFIPNGKPPDNPAA